MSQSGPQRETAAVTRSATRVGMATMLSRVFGLARDTAFAALFGTGFLADAFNLAYLLPNFFRRVVGEGNLNPAFLPVFTGIREHRGPEEASRFYRRVLGALLAVLVALVALGVLASPWLVRLYARDWSANPDEMAFAIWLLRLLFPSLLFAGGAALAGATLNAHRHFAVPALSPILLNTCFLLGALVALRFEDRPDRLVAFSAGGLAGGLAAWLVQFPKLRSFGIGLRPTWRPHDPDVRRVAALMLPGVVALGATQLNLFVDTLLALRLDEGSLTALRLGNRVTLLPLGVIAVAVSTTALPTLALKAASGNHRALLDTLGHTLRLLLTLLVPAAVALAVLADSVVTLLFQYGEFTADRSVPMTAGVLRVYAMALPAFGLVKGLAPGYYAMQDTRTPVKLAAIAVAVNIALDFAFVVPWGLNGLALATVVASWLNVVLLSRGLRRTIGPLPQGSLRGALGRIGLGTAVMAGAVLVTLAAGAGQVADASVPVRVVRVGACVAVGLVALLVVYRLTGHREMREVLASLRPGGRS